MNCFNFLGPLFCLLLYSCTSSSYVFGTYRSNFAISGGLMEQIILKQDSSFEYQSRGHWTKFAKGHYTIKSNKLILNYEFQPIDTAGLAYISSVGYGWIEDDKKRWETSFSKLFFIKNGKLLATDSTTKIIRKARIKPFLKRLLKRYYLKKIPSIIGNSQVEITR